MFRFVCIAFNGQKRALDPPLEEVVSHPKWMLGTKPRSSSAKAGFDLSDISLVTEVCLLDDSRFDSVDN